MNRVNFFEDADENAIIRMRAKTNEYCPTPFIRLDFFQVEKSNVITMCFDSVEELQLLFDQLSIELDGINREHALEMEERKANEQQMKLNHTLPY